MSIRVLKAFALLSCALSAGCRSGPESQPTAPATIAAVDPAVVPAAPTISPDPATHGNAAQPGTGVAPWLIAGQSVEGREIEYSVHGSGDLTVLLIASIHGDEECGTPLLERLHAELARGAEADLLVDRRLVIVPRVNPDGLLANRRNNSNHVDLNRNFPSQNFQGKRRYGSVPLSQPESRAVFDLLERFEPARVLSFHMQAAMIDFDGPSEGLAQAAAAAAQLKVGHLGANPGSLGSYVGVDLARQILTIEQPSSAWSLDDEAAWDTYAPMIRAAIQYPAKIKGPE